MALALHSEALAFGCVCVHSSIRASICGCPSLFVTLAIVFREFRARARALWAHPVVTQRSGRMARWTGENAAIGIEPRAENPPCSHTGLGHVHSQRTHTMISPMTLHGSRWLVCRGEAARGLLECTAPHTHTHTRTVQVWCLVFVHTAQLHRTLCVCAKYRLSQQNGFKVTLLN